jgi:hypothetical protein
MDMMGFIMELPLTSLLGFQEAMLPAPPESDRERSAATGSWEVVRNVGRETIIHATDNGFPSTSDAECASRDANRCAGRVAVTKSGSGGH